jgi:hypothetical protein
VILYLFSREEAYLNGTVTSEKHIQSGWPSIWGDRRILSGSNTIQPVGRVEKISELRREVIE